MVDRLENPVKQLVQASMAAGGDGLPASIDDEVREFFDALTQELKEERKKLVDVSRLEAEAKQREILKALLECNPQLIWTADPQGRCNYFNGQWLKFTGTCLEENLNQGWLNVIHPEERLVCSEAWAKSLEAGSDFTAEVRLRRVDGQYRWHQAHAFAVRDKQGQIEQWYGTYCETEMQRRLMDEVIEARDRAEIASRLKSEFVANISHELRTPMNGVLGMVELLLREGLDAKAREYALMIQEAGKSLLSIINDILDFSKIEAGKLELSNCDFDVETVLEAVGEILGPDAEAKDLELLTFVDPGLPRSLLGDPQRLRQVLINLGGNAVKFTEKGSIFLRAEKADIEANCVRVRFTISDSGIGIPEEKRETLFEPFTQICQSFGREYCGTGLGLSISKKLVDLMGGDLTVESSNSVGSVFSFTLLFPITALPPLPSAVPEAFCPGDVMLVGLRKATESCIVDYARAWGASVTSISSFAAAADTLQGLKSRPTAIFVEERGNREDCLAFGQKIKSIARLANTRIVYISNLSSHSSLEQVIKAPAESCLTRPLYRADLLECISAQEGSSNRARTQEVSAVSLKLQPAISKEGTENRILVVDDNPMNQHVARLLLKDLGLDVQVVGNGIEAVSAVKRQHFDLIFLDCQMPEVNGYVTCQIIKQIQQRRGQNIPVIAMTANAMSGSRELCFAAGMDDYVCKPVDPARLEKMVRHWLDGGNRGEVRPPLLPDNEDSQALPPTQCLDLEQLKKKFNEKAVRQLLTMFKNSAEGEVGKMQLSLAGHSYREAGSQAHAFSGACSTICASRLQKHCKELEMAAEIADRIECGRIFDEIKDTLVQTLGLVDEILSS